MGALATYKKKAEETLSKARSAAARYRTEARNDAGKARVLALVEVPIAGAVAGVLDVEAKPIKEVVPWSAPAGLVIGIGGILAGSPDIVNAGAGMLAGAAHQVAGNAWAKFRGKA